MVTRFAGLAAIAAGVLWVSGGIAMNATAVNPSLGYKELTAGIFAIVGGAILLAAVAAVLVARQTVHGGRAPLVGGALLLAGAALTPFPWPIMFVGFLFGLAGAATFGFAMYRLGGRPTAALVGAAAIGMLLFNTEDARALLAVPYGLVWAVFGLDLIVRPSSPSVPPRKPASP